MPIALILTPALFFIFTGCFDQDQNQIQSANLFSQIPVSQLTYHGVVQRSIGLKFNTKKSEISEITASIQLPMDYTEPLKYKWTLGENVKIQNGDLSGRIENYEKNKKIFLKISVLDFNSDATKHIRFEIGSEKTSPSIFADGIVSNNKKNSFEEIVKEVENYKKENAK